MLVPYGCNNETTFFRTRVGSIVLNIVLFPSINCVQFISLTRVGSIILNIVLFLSINCVHFWRVDAKIGHAALPEAGSDSWIGELNILGKKIIK